jgi:hypothetical protein
MDSKLLKITERAVTRDSGAISNRILSVSIIATYQQEWASRQIRSTLLI